MNWKSITTISCVLSALLATVLLTQHSKIRQQEGRAPSVTSQAACSPAKQDQDKSLQHLSISSGLGFIRNNKANISGTSSFSILDIEVDDEPRGEVHTTNLAFNVIVDVSAMVEGWHLVTVHSTKGSSEQLFSARIWIHKIANSPSVLVDDATIQRAQREKAEHCMPGVQSNIIEHYTPATRYFCAPRLVSRPAYIANDTSTTKHDKNGIPMCSYSTNTWSYNPLSIAQRALGVYYRENQKPEDADYIAFIKYADWLIDYQSADGSFRYCFEFTPIADSRMASGWVSGMAQGQVLSVYARAYLLTKDEKYLKAGAKALEFAVAPGDGTQTGCTVTLGAFASQSEELKKYKDYSLCEEYILTPPMYVLNGDLFALIGLYDWMIVSTEEYGSDIAAKAFKSGCKSIELLLPYYDFKVYSSYSLVQYMGKHSAGFRSPYAHNCHIYLLHTLAELTGNKVFDRYYKLFLSYVEDPKQS